MLRVAGTRLGGGPPPGRLSDFDPDWLDRFCLSGQGVWRRRLPDAPGEGTAATLRMAPITLLRRQDLATWEAITTSPEPTPVLSPSAEAVHAALGAGGALFFDDLLARLRLLPSQLETALSELAGEGLAACDGFAGLRALSARAGTGRRRTCEGWAAQMAAAGRWSLTGMPRASDALPVAKTGTGGGAEIEGGAEFAARVLLDRYGVVFRRLCTRAGSRRCGPRPSGRWSRRGRSSSRSSTSAISPRSKAPIIPVSASSCARIL